jgi:hypothetical protein
MKKLLLIALIFASCKREAQKQVQSTNSNFNVELLFEVDGCKVYRFRDGENYKYFTNCKGSVSWDDTKTQQSGKTTQTTTEHNSIETQ